MNKKETQNSEKLARLQEVLKNENPFSMSVSNPLERLYLAESLINVTKTALIDLEDNYGEKQINSIDLPCSLLDVRKCLDIAGRLLPFDDVDSLSQIRKLLK